MVNEKWELGIGYVPSAVDSLLLLPEEQAQLVDWILATDRRDGDLEWRRKDRILIAFATNQFSTHHS